MESKFAVSFKLKNCPSLEITASKVSNIITQFGQRVDTTKRGHFIQKA